MGSGNSSKKSPDDFRASDRQLELFHQNNIPDWVVSRLQKDFAKIAGSCTAKIAVIDFFFRLKFNEETITPMALKVFEALDYDCSGTLSFEEFVLAVWNIGISKIQELSGFVTAPHAFCTGRAINTSLQFVTNQPPTNLLSWTLCVRSQVCIRYIFRNI